MRQMIPLVALPCKRHGVHQPHKAVAVALDARLLVAAMSQVGVGEHKAELTSAGYQQGAGYKTYPMSVALH